MRRPLYGWLSAEAISITGTRVSMIALPLFVLATTGSPTRTGLVALAETLPLVLLKVLGGPVIDRVGARRVAITCDVASVLVVGAIPLLYDAGLLPFGALLVLVALAGGLRGPGDGAKQAMVPSLVADAGVPMERATGLSGTVERTAAMLGAAAGGVLVATVGAANALLVDAASFGLAAAVLAWATRPLLAPGLLDRPGAPARPLEQRDAPMSLRQGPAVEQRGVPAPNAETPAPTQGGAHPSYGRQLREGFTFLRSDRVLFGITVMVALTNLLDAAWVAVLVPVWSIESGGGATAVGLLFATSSGAAALGALGAATWAARLPRYSTYLVAFLVAGAPRWVIIGLDSPLAVVLVVAGTAGFAAGFINPVLGAVIFERIPADLVGRVSSLTTAMCYALIPFGGLLGGLLIAGPGLAAAFFACGAAYFVATMLPAVDPRWRELDRRADAAPGM